MIFDEKIGEFLIRKEFLTEDECAESISYGSEKKIRLGEAAVELGYLKSDELLFALAQYFSLPWIEKIGPLDINRDIIRILGGESEIGKMKIVPLLPSKLGDGVNFHDSGDTDSYEAEHIIAISDPSRMDIMQKVIAALRGESVMFVLAPEDEIIKSMQTADEVLPDSEKGGSVSGKRFSVVTMSPERLVENVMTFAVSKGCTDIHVEKLNRNDGLLIRIRLHGALEKYASIPTYSAASYEELVAYVKVKGGMAPDQKLLPQDGGWRWNMGDRPINLRVATIPTAFRYEKLSLRILDTGDNFSLETLGFSDSVINTIEKSVTKSSGLILVTGPTGSGKTTTMYGALSRVNGVARKIYTVEDPVEYVLPMATQIQVNQAQDLTFPRVLRSIMRHDPDIIFVGEIRDEETALIALQFAMTGHLVLATLHTNDAISAASRLLSLKAPMYMVASTLSLTFAQRLVRINCPKCLVPTEPTPLEREVLQLPDTGNYMSSKGCPACGGTGVSGRKAIVEYIDFDHYPDLEVRMNEKGWERAIWGEEITSKRTRSMYFDAMRLVFKGEVSPANAMAVVRPCEFD